MENVFATNLDGKNLISLDSVITVLSKDANHVLGVAFFALNALIPKPISKVASVSALKTTPWISKAIAIIALPLDAHNVMLVELVSPVSIQIMLISSMVSVFVKPFTKNLIV